MKKIEKKGKQKSDSDTTGGGRNEGKIKDEPEKQPHSYIKDEIQSKCVSNWGI